MKKTWLKRTLLGVAVSTALLGSLAAYSAEGGGFHHGPPTPEQIAQHESMMLAHIGKKLNLDANQAAKLKVLGDLLVAQHTPPAAGTRNASITITKGLFVVPASVQGRTASISASVKR